MTKRALRTVGWIGVGAAAVLLGLGSAIAGVAGQRGPGPSR